MTLRVALPAAALVAALGCGHAAESGSRIIPASEQARDLRLGETASGSTVGWDWEDNSGRTILRFVVEKTASYRFFLEGAGKHVPEATLFTLTPRDRELDTFISVKPSIPLEPGAYYVDVDYNRVDRGPFALRVEEDDSLTAAIRPEDAFVVQPVCEHAPGLEGVALGTYQSTSGGPRASCGGVGGTSMHRLRVPSRAVVTIAAEAQFKVALELRSECIDHRPIQCVAGGGFSATLSAAVDAGEYLLVVDSVEVGSLSSGLPGAGVRGAYRLQVRVEPG